METAVNADLAPQDALPIPTGDIAVDDVFLASHLLDTSSSTLFLGSKASEAQPELPELDEVGTFALTFLSFKMTSIALLVIFRP